MDVDNDLEGNLLQQFSSMGTTDKEVLIAEFQNLLGNQLNPAGFPELAFVSDVTVGEGEAVPPNTTFTKTWRVENSGDESWPPGCQLRFCQGENLANTDRVLVETLGPRATTDISVQMQARSEPGTYQSQWRMCTATGMFFGESVWVIITVAEGGVLGVTQQLSRFGNEFVHNPSPQGASNPFLSPSKTNQAGTDSMSCLPAFMSPNDSLVAQQGSPYTSQLSPSPDRTAHTGAGLPNHTTAPARTLFPGLNGGAEGDGDCDTMQEEEMS
ncbi:ILRUN-like protein [Mya arenaria]|uniref:ILRUN-like protein n=1 Tax=Mya arenaria TaxID=6604 RepID=A0ABY7E1B2_MYAAR|nr:ILRUN-like protein [Mya arenaria]